MNNGELVTVRRVLRDGSLAVTGDDGTHKTLGPAQRLFVRGYAVTSYGSQGKTVDTVLLCDAPNVAATSAEQWYVTVSRGRKRVVVFTSDKEALRSAIQHTAARELALDLKTLPTPGAAPTVADSLATVERLRHHQAVMAHVQGHAQRQRIAV